MPKASASKSSSAKKSSSKASIKKFPSKKKKPSLKKLPYHSLRQFQGTVRDEIRNLHDATEGFVRLAVNKAIEHDNVEKIEKHVLEIGKNIDELEEMLFKLSLKK